MTQTWIRFLPISIGTVVRGGTERRPIGHQVASCNSVVNQHVAVAVYVADAPDSEVCTSIEASRDGG
jgi:hypothetical protein